jgi:hypothetical protein
MRLTFASRSGGRALLVPGQLPLILRRSLEVAKMGLFRGTPLREGHGLPTGAGQNAWAVILG